MPDHCWCTTDTLRAPAHERPRSRYSGPGVAPLAVPPSPGRAAGGTQWGGGSNVSKHGTPRELPALGSRRNARAAPPSKHRERGRERGAGLHQTPPPPRSPIAAPLPPLEGARRGPRAAPVRLRGGGGGI